MRTRLLAAAAILFVTGQAPAVDPPLPPIVFQIQPEAQVLDSLRGAADMIGGEKGVKVLNKGLKEIFGEKGLEGLDINRPIVGYVVLAPKPQDITAVLALPITNEKDFLTLCDRVNRDKLRVDEKDKTLYHLPPLDPRYKALLRFSDQYAYIVYGFNPAPHAELKALVPMPKLYDPTDRGLIAARVHFDRIPLAVKLAAPALFEEVKKTVFGAFNLDRDRNEWFTKAVSPHLEKLATRYFLLAGGADVLTGRLYIDPQAGNLVAEATLTAKPNTELSKVIAAYKTTPNRFGSLTNHPDTVAAFHTRAPLFAPEVRTAVVAAMEAGQKQNGVRLGVGEKATLDEFFKGLTRVVKDGDLDVAVAFRGPDKDGWFTLIGGLAFDDPAAFEKEVKAMLKTLPPAQQERLKWDADKVGKVGIHTYHFEQGGFVDFTKVLGGDKCIAAFAFAPQGLIGAMGPDAVSVLKDVLAVKPLDAPAMEMVANPGRIVKAFEKAGPENRVTIQMADLFGREDKKLPVMSVVVEGGKELKATYTINLKLYPRLMFADVIDRANREPNDKPADPFDK